MKCLSSNNALKTEQIIEIEISYDQDIKYQKSDLPLVWYLCRDNEHNNQIVLAENIVEACNLYPKACYISRSRRNENYVYTLLE
jgi:hypothetical protein